MAENYVVPNLFEETPIEKEPQYVVPDLFVKKSNIGQILEKGKEVIAQGPEAIKRQFSNPQWLTQTIQESFGGESPSQFLTKKYLEGEQERYAKEGTKFQPSKMGALATVLMGGAGDIASSPATYLAGPITKLATSGKVVQEGLKKVLPTLAKDLIKTEPTAIKPISEPIRKITKAIQEEVIPTRKAQEAIYSAERGKRIGEALAVGEKVPGEAGYYASASKLKGAYEKVPFSGVKEKLTQDDLISLFSEIQSSPSLVGMEKFNAKGGLIKLIGGKVGGKGGVPNESEIALLSKVFPPDFINTVLNKRPLMDKIWETSGDVLNVPRALMATGDMSFGLRQGLFLGSRYPKQFLSAFGNQVKYFFKEQAYKDLSANIAARPTYPLMKEAGLSLTEIAPKALNSAEEAFRTGLAEKIPVIGKMVRASNRAYSGFANKLRADVFDYMVQDATKLGHKVEGKLLTDIGNFVNTATGRGTMGGNIEKAYGVINAALFSPRLMYSRLQLMNPKYYVNLEPYVRKQALGNLLTFGSLATTITSLASLAGAKVGRDPRSADFGKVKVGNTRYEVTGGFQQYLRLAAQLISGELISSTTGVKTTMGEGYKPLTRGQIIARFISGKTSPALSLALSMMSGTSAVGEMGKPNVEIAKRFIPMVIQDAYDLAEEGGALSALKVTPAIFGVGVQTYGPSPKQVVGASNVLNQQINELYKQGRTKEAQALRNKSKSLMAVGEIMEPSQKNLSYYEKLKKEIPKNTRLSPQEKAKRLTEVDKFITQKQEQQKKKFKELKGKYKL